MRTLRPYSKENGSIEAWVEEELNPFLSDIRRLLDRSLSFDAQFASFAEEIEIDSGDTATIRNRLRAIPDEWAVMDVDGAGAGPLERGATEWTRDLLYIKNTGADGSFKIRFFSNLKR